MSDEKLLKVISTVAIVGAIGGAICVKEYIEHRNAKVVDAASVEVLDKDGKVIAVIK